MATTYSYPYASFPLGVRLESLRVQIKQNTLITSALVQISIGVTIEITFANALSVAEKTELDTLVANHNPSSNIVVDTIYTRVMFGNGSDGNVTLTTVTTHTRGMYYNNLTITNTTLNTNGYRLFVRGTLTLNGNAIIAHNGVDGGNATSLAIGSGATQSASAFSIGIGGGGGNGGLAGLGVGLGNLLLALGGSGGSGGSAGATASSSGTTAIIPSSSEGGIGLFNTASFAVNGRSMGVQSVTNGITYSTPAIIMGGGGGAGGSSSSTKAFGGGGGGGAGIIIIAAGLIATNGTGNIIRANGGNGGNGGVGTNGGSGGGGGGGGGVVVILSYTNTTSLVPSLALQVLGGNGGSGATAEGVVVTSGSTGSGGRTYLLVN